MRLMRFVTKPSWPPTWDSMPHSSMTFRLWAVRGWFSGFWLGDQELVEGAEEPLAAVVGEDTNWAANKEGVEILFDPYSVAPYVVGPRECRLSYADVKQWLNPSGPLPPQ